MRGRRNCPVLSCGRDVTGIIMHTPVHSSPIPIYHSTDASLTNQQRRPIQLGSFYRLSFSATHPLTHILHPHPPPTRPSPCHPINCRVQHSTRRQGAEGSSTQLNSTCTVEHLSVPFLSFVCSRLLPPTHPPLHNHNSTYQATNTWTLSTFLSHSHRHASSHIDFLSPTWFVCSLLVLSNTLESRTLCICVCSCLLFVSSSLLSSPPPLTLSPPNSSS